MTIEEAFEEFMLAIQADGLSAATIQWYEIIIAQMTEHFTGREIETITTHDMRSYITLLRGRGTRYVKATQKPEQDGMLSKDTIGSYKRAMFRFWNWATNEYELKKNPMKGIKREKRTRQAKRGITWATFIELCKSAENQDDVFAARDIAILYLLADTGIRAAGLCSFLDDDIDLAKRQVIVTEKGIRSRSVPFTPDTRRVLLAWLERRPNPSNAFFCSLRPQDIGNPLTPSGLTQLLKRLAARQGIEETVSAHRLRHMFSREYLKRGGDLASLSRILGHEGIEITADYYSVFTEAEEAETHDRWSPINRLTQ